MMAAEVLFSRDLPIVVKNHVNDDRKSVIKVNVESVTHTSPLHRKELVVRLTDDSDLFFLYTLKLGEEDFQSLKTQQGLLVDFSAFPQKFIVLLELCLQEENNEIPKYLLQFHCPPISGSDKDTWCLNVVETNPFKHLTHLSLKFLPGKDSDVKTYLADCLKLAKGEIDRLDSTLRETETTLSKRLQQTQQLLSTKSKDLDCLKIEWDSKQQELNANFSQQVTCQKEKAFEVQSSYQLRMEREKKELEQAHLNIVKQMEAKCYELESANKELTDLKYKNESTIRELRARSVSLDEELHRLKQEVNSLRKENNLLDGDFHEQENVINQLKTRVAVLDQECGDKEMLLNKQQNLLDAELEQKRRCEDEIDRKQHQITKMDASIKTMTDELGKGNEIIKKLQGELRNSHAKVKLRNQIASEQEKLITSKEMDLTEFKQDLTCTKENLKQKTEENCKLSEQLESTVRKLEESKQLLKTNENVINWLNKQITESQLSHQRTGSMETISPTINYRPLASGSQRLPSMPPSCTGSTIVRSRSSVSSSTILSDQNNVSPAHTVTPPSSRLVAFNYAPRLGAGLMRDRRANMNYVPTKQSPIPEQDENENELKTNKENLNPFLDAKYLQRGGVPLRENSPSSLTTGKALPPTLLSKNQPPKTSPSAYFPNKASLS